MARQQVDEAVARAAPGIKDVDAQYAELARQSAGLQRGGQVLDGGKTAIRPAELAEEITTAALPQGTQIGPSAVPMRMRQGVRADIDRIVGTNVNDLNALERTLATPQDWNHQKLGTVFGDNARDQIVGAITGNRQFRKHLSERGAGIADRATLDGSECNEGAAGGNVPGDTTLTISVQ